MRESLFAKSHHDSLTQERFKVDRFVLKAFDGKAYAGTASSPNEGIKEVIDGNHCIKIRSTLQTVINTTV